MLFVSLVLSFSKFIHIRTYFSLSMGSFSFSRRGSWRGIWNYCWFILISRLQFGSVAAKHDSSIAAFAMASIQVACLGIEMGLTVPYFMSSPRAGNLVAHTMGCWLHGSSQSELTSVWANNEIAKPIHMQKKLPKASKDKCGLRRAVAVWLLRLSMSTQRGGLFRPCVRLGPAAPALAVAVSAKPLQHQASCFRLSKLLWLVLTLLRLLTLKLHYLLSQFLYIADRDGLFAKIGIGWGGLKRQGKDFGFLVATWILPMGWI